MALIHGGKGRLLRFGNPYIYQRVPGLPTPLAWYQPKQDAFGAIIPTVATKYRNWANPGTYDLTEGTAPVWAANTGLTFNGSSHYLRTGIMATSGYSLLVRFSAGPASGGSKMLVGSYGPTSTTRLFIVPNDASSKVWYYAGSTLTVAPQLLAGTLAIANTAAYRDGSAEAGAMTGLSGPGVELYVGAGNNNGLPSYYCPSVTTVVAIWNTDIAAYMSDLHAAIVAGGL